MIGVNVRVDHERDAQPERVGQPPVLSSLQYRVDHGADAMTGATNEVRRGRDRPLVQELSEQHVVNPFLKSGYERPTDPSMNTC